MILQRILPPCIINAGEEWQASRDAGGARFKSKDLHSTYYLLVLTISVHMHVHLSLLFS